MQRDLGFRTSIMISEDVEKLIQRARAQHKKVYGYAPSRSAMITLALRNFFKQPNWIRNFMEKGATNGQ